MLDWKRRKKSAFRNVILTSFLSIFIFVLISPLAYAADKPIDQVREILKNRYVDPVGDQILNMTDIDDMVKALDDPYTEHFTAEESKEFEDSINNKFYGIGVQIEKAEEGIKILSVVDDSPAKKVGIQEGDIIIKAEGVELAGLPTDTAVTYLRGAENSFAHIVVKRGAEELSFTVERKELKDATVKSTLLEGHIGYIRVYSFGETTADEFKSEYKKVTDSKTDMYIVDLRNNGGGYLTTALKMAGFFIGRKPAMQIADNSGEKLKYYAAKQDIVIDKPVFFLVNEYSASASEILSAAVKDYKKAYFIGNTTYGKGVAQEMYTLSDDSVLKVTVSRFYSPNGNVIQKVGISPDLKTSAEDAFPTAILLASKSSNAIDKTGFVKVKLGESTFEVDTKVAGGAAYWKAFQDLLDKADSVEVGTAGGWKSYDKVPSSNYLDLYYGQYDKLPALTVPEDKKFTVAFTGAVAVTALQKDQIELMDASTGERVETTFEQIDAKSIRVIPKEKLSVAKKYFLVINDSSGGTSSVKIVKGALAKIEVAQ